MEIERDAATTASQPLAWAGVGPGWGLDWVPGRGPGRGLGRAGDWTGGVRELLEVPSPAASWLRDAKPANQASRAANQASRAMPLNSGI